MHHQLNLAELNDAAHTNPLIYFVRLSHLSLNMWHQSTELCQLVFLEQSMRFSHRENILDVVSSAPIALTVLVEQVLLIES